MVFDGSCQIRQQKVSQQVIDRIRQAILTEQLDAGDKLPNEQSLARHFNVSRQTMRESLCALETMGLIKVRSGIGGGAFVTDVGLKPARDGLINFIFNKNFTIQNITEVRLSLEPDAAFKAAEVMTDQERRVLVKILDNCRERIQRQDSLANLRRLEIAFHAAIVKATKNPILILLHNLAEHLLWDVKTQLGTDSEFSGRVLLRHEKILEALFRRDSEAAAEHMRQDIIYVETFLMKLADEARLSFQ